MKTDANILEAYVTKLKKVKGQLPSHADQSRPHISRISVASGIPRRYFYTPEGCRRLNLAIQEIGLSTRGCGNPAGLKTRVEEDAECIESYLRWLESYGMRLPENPTLRGQVFLEQLEIEAGLRPATLDAHRLSKKECPSSHLMKMIESSVLHLGLEVRVLTQCAGSPWEPLTYEMLL